MAEDSIGKDVGKGLKGLKDMYGDGGALDQINDSDKPASGDGSKPSSGDGSKGKKDGK